MDKNTELWQRLGVTPGKLALIGVLAVTLVAVLWYQYHQYGARDEVAQSSADTALQRDRWPARPAADAASKNPADRQSDAKRTVAQADSINQALWKAPALTSVIEYDPFALPESFPQPVRSAAGVSGASAGGLSGTDARDHQLASVVEELQAELEELRERGVTVIVKHRDKYVAMIGDRTVHVGDEINGFTVKSIEPGGVLVERKIEE